MNIHWEKHLIKSNTSIKEALSKLNQLSLDAVLFVVDNKNKLVGSLTDGDVRRALITGASMESPLLSFINNNPKSIVKSDYTINQIVDYRKKNLQLLPVVSESGVIVNVINFRRQESYLPIDALIMAGGKGTRLRPLTEATPKPLLRVGNKPIIEHNLDRLHLFGIDDVWISLNYLGNQIEDYLGNGFSRGQYINYVWENRPLGTLGAIKLIDNFKHDYVLITNSDLLTKLNYEDFFLDFLEKDADMSVVTIPYKVNIPYAVLETQNNFVLSFREKPNYTYYSNGGIYLIKRELINSVPLNQFYNTTDLMEKVIEEKGKLISYPTHDYWLDIGRHDDYTKACSDIQSISFDN